MGNYDELPQEIMLAIMCRVPAKSVGLCRCVSKPWRTLLCQPVFVKTHLQHAKTNSLESLAIIDPLSIRRCDVYLAPLNNAHHMFDEITVSLTKLSFPGFNPVSLLGMYGFCDGLLLVFSDEDGILVMNPTTREIRKVPPSPHAFSYNDGISFRFMCEIGYDSVTDDYKIVTLYLHCEKENGRYVTHDALFDVYSLKIGSWKTLESSPSNYMDLGISATVFLGGCIHWLYVSTTDDKVGIVAFDLVDGKEREIPLPSSMLDDLQGFYMADMYRYKLVVLEGCLCMFYATEYGGEVWMMKEYGVSKSWTKFVGNHPYAMLECSLSNQKQVVMSFDHDNHVVWNLKQGTWKNIVFNGFSDRSRYLHVRANFVESLVSPHGKL